MFPSELNSNFKIRSSRAFSWFLSLLIRTISLLRWSSKSGRSNRTTSLNAKQRTSLKILRNFFKCQKYLDKTNSSIWGTKLIFYKFSKLYCFTIYLSIYRNYNILSKLHYTVLCFRHNCQPEWTIKIRKYDTENQRNFYPTTKKLKFYCTYLLN